MIKYPDTFRRSVSADFDGTFEWEYLQGIFPRGIMPMDFDGVIELGGHFLIFETKDPGVEIPVGQMMTLKRISHFAQATVYLIWGKVEPIEFNVIYLGKVQYASPQPTSTIDIQRRCMKWIDWVEKHSRLGN